MHNSAFKHNPMGHKNKESQRMLSRNLDKDNNMDFENNKNCDKVNLLPQENMSPPQSPTEDNWCKWPSEKYTKIKSRDESPEKRPNISPNENDSNKNGITFDEAIQSISLTYSPVTKQLHFIDKTEDEQKTNLNKLDNIANTRSNIKCFKKDDYLTNVEVPKSVKNEQKKLGHRRMESRFSTLSFSSSGSLLDSEENADSLEENTNSNKTNSSFLTRSFSWRPSTNSETSSVWKMFKKSPQETIKSSKPQVIASSSALIQHQRPSNLPAKSQEEEQRHKEEYKAILAAAKQKEAQNLVVKQKHEKIQIQIEEQQAFATKHFLQNVLPNWNEMKSKKRTRDLWWEGLPSNIRGKVWCRAIGNDLNLTPELYNKYLSTAHAIEPTTHSDIHHDISRTFPHLGIFQEGGPFSDALRSLLETYVSYKPDVGYAQGMSFIAAILILNMEAYSAFVCFANLLSQPLHLAAFTLDNCKMDAFYGAFDEVFTYNLPKLSGHFLEAGLTPDLYLFDWVCSIFGKAMPLDVTCRIWDVFFRDGYEFVFRTALGILSLYQDKLLQMDFSQGAQFLSNLPEDISAKQLFKCISNVTTNIGKRSFEEIVDSNSR